MSIRSLPFRCWLLGVLLLALGVSMIDPTNRFDMLLEHTPTVAFILFLIVYERVSSHGPLSNTSYVLILVFVLLHVLGAYYLYSNVPYDAWAAQLWGRSISDVFQWERNHYDRLVHFLFGVLCLRPMVELVSRGFALRRWKVVLIAVLMLHFLSAVYEWAEWLLSIVASPDAVENYNGQQGDVFDPLKDMLLAFTGSVMSGVVIVLASGVSGREAGAERRGGCGGAAG